MILINFSFFKFTGFFSTEDDSASGNYGLKDQSAALQWIQNHISEFGGDPTNVTISGESSGAVDVGLHLVSPLSKGSRNIFLVLNRVIRAYKYNSDIKKALSGNFSWK